MKDFSARAHKVQGGRDGSLRVVHVAGTLRSPLSLRPGGFCSPRGCAKPALERLELAY